MDFQKEKVRTFTSQRLLHENRSGDATPGLVSPGGNGSQSEARFGTRQQRTTAVSSTSPAAGNDRINPELQWEKVPVIVNNSNNSIKVISASRFNGPPNNVSNVSNLVPISPLDTSYHPQHQQQYSQQDQHLLQQQQQYLQQHFQQQYHQQQQQQQQQQQRVTKIVKVPMTKINTSSKSEVPDEENSLPVVEAKVSHNYEVVQTTLVHPGSPLGAYSSQIFTVDESELRDFDPFAKINSILASLDLDLSQYRKHAPNLGHIPVTQSEFFNTERRETSFGPEDDCNNNTVNNIYQQQRQQEILEQQYNQQQLQLQQQQQQQTRQEEKHHRPQHLLSSKSSVGDFKSSPLVRKPSIRRKSNPLAAFLTTGSKEMKKQNKVKPGGSGGLPSGLKIRERGSSLTRTPTDAKSRLEQQIGSNPSIKNADPLSNAWTDYIEKSYDKFDVVLRKEEEGYGIQLHGQYPVVVDSVRPGGGAAKNGIMKGDIIFKINGNLVVKHSHEMVINCFKNAGPFMGLTLLRAPQTGLDDEAKRDNLTSLFVQSDKISKPAPAARDKNKELEKERYTTLRSMYEKAFTELEQLKTEAQKSPNELMLMKRDNQAKVVAQLEKRLSLLEPCPGQPCVSSQPTVTASQGNGSTTGHSHNSLPKLSIPGEPGFGASLAALQSQSSSNIMSMEGLDCTLDDDDDAYMQHKEFEDLNCLKQSPAHLACFLKYLIHNSNPGYVFFNVVATSYSQASLKDTYQSLRWAYEIYLAFMLDSSPLPLNLPSSTVRSVENCINAGKDIKGIFQQALVSVQEVLVKQLDEFQHQRTLGLGNFFGEEYLPKSKTTLATSSFTAPVLYHTSPKPPLSLIHTPSNSSSSSSAGATSRACNNLSSSSFTSYPKSSSSSADPYAVEKILWDVFVSCLGRDEEDVWRPDETRPAVASSLATFFRHQGIPLSRQNQIILEAVPSFVWRDKKALKNKLKGQVVANGHTFIPHLSNLMSIVPCSLCSNVLWGAGYQGHKCNYCDMILHKSCMKLNTVPLCSKVPFRHKSGRDDITSTFYTTEPSMPKSSFNSLPLRKKKKVHSLDDNTAFVLSDSEAINTPDVEPNTPSQFITSPSSGTITPLILGHPLGLHHGLSFTQTTPSTEVVDSDMEVEQDLPPLSKVIPEDALSGLIGATRKRQEIINELFYTERSHVKSLLILIHYYLRPMRNDPRIDQQLVDVLFPNLESITQWHKELSNEFKVRRREQPVVHEVGDILIRRFSGPTGFALQEQCSEFCKNQLFNLDLLKNKQRQDAYLNHFIMTTAQKEICKKQDLKDRLPKVMQRLTKYPLLFENLLKVNPAGTEEHARLLRALKNVRMVLDNVNETARECENRRVLLDIQRRMDARPLENVQHPILDEFRNLQLTDRKLRHYGHLTWNANVSKNIELFLALFEDLLVIFQNQDNRLILKCEMAGADVAKFVFAPILKLGNLLIKDAPRRTRTFYLINASKEASQMYTLSAKTREEREVWMKQIRETIEDYKKKHSQSQTPAEIPDKPSILTETSPCYEVVEPEPLEVSIQEVENETQVEQEPTDTTDGGKEDADDDELNNNDQSPALYNPEKELKRQIIATNELMMDKVKALSEMHHIESPNFDLSEKTLPLNTDSESFITAMVGVIEGMTNFFTSLPDVVIDGDGNGDRPSEWDPVESLLELGGRLEMLVRQLEDIVSQKKSGLGIPPPVPTSEPPLLDEPEGNNPRECLVPYVESNL